MINQNPFRYLFSQVQQRIRDEVPGIRHIDEDKGQIDANTVKPPVNFPCVLIDFDLSFEDIGDNIQEADGMLILRLAFPPFSSAASLMPDAVRDKALSYFDYEYALYKALHGWKPAGMGYLLRRRSFTVLRKDRLRVREISFAIQFTDHGAQPVRNVTQLNTADIGSEAYE